MKVNIKELPYCPTPEEHRKSVTLATMWENAWREEHAKTGISFLDLFPREVFGPKKNPDKTTV